MIRNAKSFYTYIWEKSVRTSGTSSTDERDHWYIYSRTDQSADVLLLQECVGSGKTVMMTEISQKLRENDQWIVIELNPATDLLKGLLSKFK